MGNLRIKLESVNLRLCDKQMENVVEVKVVKGGKGSFLIQVSYDGGEKIRNFLISKGEFRKLLRILK